NRRAVQIEIGVAVFLLGEALDEQLWHRVLAGHDQQLHAGEVERGDEDVGRRWILGGDAIELRRVEGGRELLRERRRLRFLGERSGRQQQQDDGGGRERLHESASQGNRP